MSTPKFIITASLISLLIVIGGVLMKPVVTDLLDSSSPSSQNIGTTNDPIQQNNVQDSANPQPNNNSNVPTPQPTPALDTCIITVKGVQYDIQPFRRQHSGGDIFQCGTDMTSTFDSVHGRRELQRIEPYRIN
ncbi:hypothetical protein KC685_01325 [Candidatus Dojkabacteria bacterium]|uniref:Cytochrome b5 heme-binding domain-containing protein n=1 Tax=Candidatus Dojkabacteria bacterium TaxID=2099670 RepID=A0A955I0Q8_9BACT|nr:hypothetical protein [Candidatus Dojkabacteria bacterium]